MKKKLVLIIIAIFLIVAVIPLLMLSNSTDNLFEEKETKYALGDILEKQEQADKQIEEYIQDDSYTLENAKVIENPYGLTPLTALIIFSTEEETSIQVQINGRDVTVVESSKEHEIPIYGMYAGYDNIIKLTDDTGNVAEYTITTEKYNGDVLQVEEADEESLDDSVYFLSPNFVENCIYDKYGNLLWYITGDYAGDIEYLENGHFLISDPYQRNKWCKNKLCWLFGDGLLR